MWGPMVTFTPGVSTLGSTLCEGSAAGGNQKLANFVKPEVVRKLYDWQYFLDTFYANLP